MSEGRAPWRSFARDCRNALGDTLARFGLAMEPGAGSSHVAFAGTGGRVEIAWDAWDVELSVKVDGVWLDRLLRETKLDVVEPRASMAGLRSLAVTLAALLPKLRTRAGKVAAGRAARWQAILTGDDVSAMLEALARAPDAAVRARAAERLAWMEPPRAAMTRGLATALADPDLAVRRAAAGTLYHRAAASPRSAVAPLTRALTDADPEVRTSVLLALRQLGPRAVAAAPMVAERMQRTGARERRLAAEVLAAIGEGQNGAKKATRAPAHKRR